MSGWRKHFKIWDPEVENGMISHQDSLLKYWNDKSPSFWLKTEPSVHWHSKFYSRTFPRGDNIGLEEYNTLMNANEDDYFKSCWDKGKIILDFLHKIDTALLDPDLQHFDTVGLKL